MTSSNPIYLPKAPLPNNITLWGKISTTEFLGGHKDSVHERLPNAGFLLDRYLYILSNVVN